MFKQANEIIQNYLSENTMGDTYPSGMSRFFKILDSGEWISLYAEIESFSKEGDSDIRYKLRKVLNEISEEEFVIQMNFIINEFKQLNSQKQTTLNLIYEWYVKIKDMDAFNLLNKRVGNGIPNAMLGGIMSTPTNEIKKLRYFTMRCGGDNKHYNDFINNRIIAITWGDIDNVSNFGYDQLKEYSLNKYPNGRSYSQFNTFVNKMQVGDIVLLLQSGTNIADICVITSEPIYDQDIPKIYANYRTFEVLKTAEITFNTGVQSTILPINNTNNQNEVKELLDEEVMTKYNGIMNNINIDRNFEFSDDPYILENVAQVDQAKKYSKKDYKNINKQLIIDGAPGTGKSYNLNKEIKDNDIAHERVTFYQDYEYHNFVGSILPILDGDTVSYEFVQGPFTKILNSSLSNPEEKHYLVIEELTRGNASAIFGDIFQLLDRGDDGFSQYPISHENVLNSLDPEVKQFLINEFDGKVVLPPNLSIICTINSSDQNVFPLDTAFKRRFDYEIKSTNVDRNKFDNFDIHFGKNDEGYAISIDWINFQEKLNEFILVNLGLKEDKQVGPYFIKNYKDDTNKLKSIQTKLAMYLWNDLHKVHTISNQYIFNDKVQTLSKVDELFRTGSKADILNVLSPEFKKHFGLDNE